MGAESAAFPMGFGPRSQRTGPNSAGEPGKSVEYRPTEGGLSADCCLYRRYRPSWPGHCFGRNLMPAVSEALLAPCLLFRGMSATERKELVELMDHESFAAGSTLIQEGRSTQMLWIILSGSCQVLKHTKNGGEQELAILEKCGVFGEMSFFNPAPHSASIRSITAVEVLRLS